MHIHLNETQVYLIGVVVFSLLAAFLGWMWIDCYYYYKRKRMRETGGNASVYQQQQYRKRKELEHVNDDRNKTNYDH